jgi:alkylhydroperoxidase family enzyme
MSNRLLAVLVLAALCVTPAFADPSAAPKTVSHTGIPYKPDDEHIGPKEVVDAIRARRPGGKLLNLDRILLHSPAFAHGWNTLFGTIRGQLSLPPRVRELCIMAVAVLNHADYEWGQHEKEFLAAGGTRNQLEALKDIPTALKNENLFNDAERTALALTDEMTRSIKVSRMTMRRVRKHFPLEQLVELIGTIAGYNMASRFLVATGVEME